MDDPLVFNNTDNYLISRARSFPCVFKLLFASLFLVRSYTECAGVPGPYEVKNERHQVHVRASGLNFFVNLSGSDKGLLWLWKVKQLWVQYFSVWGSQSLAHTVYKNVGWKFCVWRWMSNNSTMQQRLGFWNRFILSIRKLDIFCNWKDFYWIFFFRRHMVQFH